MMYNFPSSTFPFYKRPVNSNHYNYYNKYYSNNIYPQSNRVQSNYNNTNSYNPFFYSKFNKSNNLNQNNIVQEKHTQNNMVTEEKNESEVFEIFGLRLHFDDILLICLIFFLYNEGVKDYYLFISLILLLLS